MTSNEPSDRHGKFIGFITCMRWFQVQLRLLALDRGVIFKMKCPYVVSWICRDSQHISVSIFLLVHTLKFLNFVVPMFLNFHPQSLILRSIYYIFVTCFCDSGMMWHPAFAGVNFELLVCSLRIKMSYSDSYNLQSI